MGRGRQKGFSHSEETKEKIKEGKLRSSKNKEERIRTFTLEEVLTQAKGDIEKSCEVYNVNLEGRRIQVYAIDWEEDWLLDYSEFWEGLFSRIIKMLNWLQTKYVGVRTIERGDKSPQQLTSILKIGERFIIKGDYELEVARREGRTSARDREIGRELRGS